MRQAGRISEKGADYLGRIGRALFCMFLVCLFCFAGGRSKTAEAAGATIAISTKNNTVEKGDIVYVVITVTSNSRIKGFEGHFTYNSRALQFMTGGNITHGNDDSFRINDTNRTAGATKITYSVKFTARQAGSASITMRKPYHVYADDGASTEMSVSYNTLNILVKKQASADSKPSGTPRLKTPKPSKKPKESSKPSGTPSESPVPTRKKGDVPASSRLGKLSVEGGELVPDFEQDIQKYSAVVTTDQKELKIDYQPKDSLAKVDVKGNKNLTEGKNIVKIIVTGTTGERTTYRLSLTVQHTDKKYQTNRVTVSEKKGKILLKGSSKIQVVPLKDEELLPEGFEKTQTTIDGKEITSYALKDSENGFVLIYGKGNEEEWYLFDKEENILMPYEKVKSWYRSMNGGTVSTVTDEERMIQSLKYVIGIMAAFCGLLIIITIGASIRAHRR